MTKLVYFEHPTPAEMRHLLPGVTLLGDHSRPIDPHWQTVWLCAKYCALARERYGVDIELYHFADNTPNPAGAGSFPLCALFCIEAGVQVLALSRQLQDDYDNRAAIAALKLHGIHVVTIPGNSYQQSAPNWHSLLPWVISAGASDSAKGKAASYNLPGWHVLAPGDRPDLPIPQRPGNSYSAPEVAAFVAALCAVNPALTHDEANKGLVRESANPAGVLYWPEKLPVIPREVKPMRVCLDPGHGGNAANSGDPGAIGPGGLREAYVNLALTYRVKELLEPAGLAVLLTREADSDVGLYERAALANDANADAFVSIHCNASDSPASGVETYCLALGGPAGKLASLIQARVVQATGAINRGVKTANFAVLRETNMPAALVEVGFISNPAEEARLKDASYQRNVARAIAWAIAEYAGVSLPEPVPSMIGKVVDSEAAVYLRGAKLAKSAIIIEGTSYLPVRLLGEALGLKVDWQPGRIDLT